MISMNPSFSILVSVSMNCLSVMSAPIVLRRPSTLDIFMSPRAPRTLAIRSSCGTCLAAVSPAPLAIA